MSEFERVIDGYFAVWNEPDPARRRELIARTWTDDASHLGPLFGAEGPVEIDEMAKGLQEHFPGHRFRLASAVTGHHDRVRFAWEISTGEGHPVAAGVDFGELAGDGRLRSITSFVDLAPNPGGGHA